MIKELFHSTKSARKNRCHGVLVPQRVWFAPGQGDVATWTAICELGNVSEAAPRALHQQQKDLVRHKHPLLAQAEEFRHLLLCFPPS